MHFFIYTNVNFLLLGYLGIQWALFTLLIFLVSDVGVKQDTLTFLNCGQLCAEIGLHAAYLGLSKTLIRERAQSLVTEEKFRKTEGWQTFPTSNLHKVTDERAFLWHGLKIWI